MLTTHRTQCSTECGAPATLKSWSESTWHAAAAAAAASAAAVNDDRPLLDVKIVAAPKASWSESLHSSKAAAAASRNYALAKSSNSNNNVETENIEFGKAFTSPYFNRNNRNNNNNDDALLQQLCLDRRGPLDHLAPTQVIKGAIRVAMQQVAMALSQYMSDQLKEDMARDEKVQTGELSPKEADEQADEWSEREWGKRWKEFPEKLLTAYLKYHAVTAVMRFYEYLASLTLDVVQMDKLTKDPFGAARRRVQAGEAPAPSLVVARECWDANLIAYLSDYSVHQIILLFGYYVYIRDKRRPVGGSKTNSSNGSSNAPPKKNEDAVLDVGSLALSLTKKSTILALSRLVSLTFASMGGAVGSVLMPGGWGTLIGINMGDGVGAQIAEEFIVTPHDEVDGETSPP